MDPEIEARIEDWPARQVSGGHEGLRTLANAEFSGAISLDRTWVFMVGGRIVGVRGGSIEGIDAASGTAYQAPAEALPLLFTMQTAPDTEVRGQYYTEETPLSEVDSTLGEAGFTGYLELSENVLSGDYYLVYHGGRSRAVAVVGTREEVLAGEEAYELAADEVGIYEVIEAPISVTDIPEAGTQDDASVGAVSAPSSESAPDAAGTSAESAEETDPVGRSEAESTESRLRDDGEPPAEQMTPESLSPTNSETGQETDKDDTSTEGDGESKPSDSEPLEADSTGTTEGAESSAASGSDSTGEIQEESPSDHATNSDSATEGQSESSSDREPATSADAPPATGQDSDVEGRVEALETELQRAENRSESLAEERSSLAQQVETLQTKLQEVEGERSGLRDRVAELEAELAERQEPAGPDRTDRPFAEAIRETTLFVRYATRSEPTLEDIPGGTDRDALDENLTVEVHTTFDRETVSIDGEPFLQALQSSPEWAFVNWLVRDLPFEIRDTGQRDRLKALMQAIPEIDRIDLQATVAVEGTAAEGAGDVEYDLLFRTKTGVPLIVGDIHQGRDPVGGDAIEDLLDRTRRVVATEDTLAAAFTISPSFFRPDALEAAQAATSSGFLSRDSRLSYVKSDRSRGFHLCLVEARDEAFHVAVPEL